MTIKPGPGKRASAFDAAMSILTAATCALMLLAFPLFGSPTRLVPPDAPQSEGASTRGYCPSNGGITYWERIQDIKYHFDDPWLVLTIKGEILNPNGCGSDSCPDYDGSPEYINGWIDWNGDGRWDPSERAIDEEFSDYRSKSYRGNLPVQVRVLMPPLRVEDPVLRVNLGWGHDPDDPCDSAWAFGDVRDLLLTDTKWVISEIRVLDGNPIAEVPDGVIWRETCEEKYGPHIETPKPPNGAPLPDSGEATRQSPTSSDESAGQTDAPPASAAETAGPTVKYPIYAAETGESHAPTDEPVTREPAAPEKTTLDPAGGNLRFTGAATFKPLDADSDGLFDVLAVEPEFVTSVAGNFAVFGDLLKDGEYISSIPAWRASIPIRYGYNGPPGTHTTRLWFSGEQIFRSGKDGPYQLFVYALSGIGLEDSVRIHTSAYSHTDFGEIDVTLSSITDVGVDLDDDGLFDVLRVTAEVSVRAEGEYNIDFSLSTGIRGHTYKNKTARLAPGTHEIKIDFDGQAINENRKDGPWGIVVSLDGAGDEWLDSREHLTQPYRVDDFEPAPIMLTRTFDDRAVDRDTNGLFDALRFTFGVEVHAESTATYHVAASLKDAPDNGRLLDLARAKRVLMPGIGTVTIGFDGAAIARGRTDGRYMVTLITIDNDENVEIGYFEPNYVTSPYRYWDFDPGTPEIAYLDTMLSRLEDTDGDGRAEYLVVSPLVKSSAAAHLMVSAALADRHGRLITQGTGATDIGREEHAYIDIRFDGRRVFGSLENGPYRVVDSRFHTHKAMVLWGPNVPPGETEPYRYDQFEPAAVITGVVEASHDSAAVLAEVRTTHAVDWTDSTGKYHLVFVDGDLDSLFVRTSHEAARQWDIYLNGQFLKTGDAVWMPIEIGRIDTLDFLAPRSR